MMYFLILLVWLAWSYNTFENKLYQTFFIIINFSEIPVLLWTNKVLFD